MSQQREIRKETPRCNANVPQAKVITKKGAFFPNILTGWGPSVKSLERWQEDVKRTNAITH